MNNLLFLSLFVILLIYYMDICKGVNMKCPICFNNGKHYHIGEISFNTNHGPKKNGAFEHGMCPVCKKNPGCTHFHFCPPCK